MRGCTDTEVADTEVADTGVADTGVVDTGVADTGVVLPVAVPHRTGRKKHCRQESLCRN